MHQVLKFQKLNKLIASLRYLKQLILFCMNNLTLNKVIKEMKHQVRLVQSMVKLRIVHLDQRLIQ